MLAVFYRSTRAGNELAREDDPARAAGTRMRRSEAKSPV